MEKKHKKQEGAVLLLVVLVLLVLTATGTYVVYATTAELQGAGATRRSFQTEEMSKSLAEGTIEWLDRVGPAVLYRHVNLNHTSFDMSGAEYPNQLATGQIGSRLYQNDIENGLNSGISYVNESNLNNVSQQNIYGLVDVYDIYRYTGNMPGSRSDGFGQQHHLKATYTARIRTQYSAIENNSSNINSLIRDRHTTSATSRFSATSGPFNL